MSTGTSHGESSQDTVESKGLLKNQPFPLLIKNFWQKQETGVLSCTRENVIKSVYFHDGNPSYAISNANEDTYAEILLEQGKITEAQAEELQMTTSWPSSRRLAARR